MQINEQKEKELDALFDEPVTIDLFINDLLDILELTQLELAAYTGIGQGSISRITSRKTTTPSTKTLRKLRSALIEKFGVSPERATIDYFFACRSLLESHSPYNVDSRFIEFNAWLHEQPEDVQEHFWEALDALKSSIEASSND
jgi:transcriptional regulator with XRE-family HTH domain